MYGYIYKTTNLINNKIYIGQHKWDKDTIDPTYIGSGKLLLEAVEKYSRENFICEILEWCETEDELNTKEIFYIDLYKSTTKFGNYNISIGGHVPRLFGCDNGNYGKHRRHTEEEKEHQSKALKEYYKTHDTYHKVKTPQLSDETRQKFSDKLREYNLTQKNYSQVSDKLIGSRFMTNGEIQGWVMQDDIEQKLKDGWYFGACKKRKCDKYGENNPAYGKHFAFANDGIINKKVLLEELDDWLDKGFVRGRIKK